MLHAALSSDCNLQTMNFTPSFLTHVHSMVVKQSDKFACTSLPILVTKNTHVFVCCLFQINFLVVFKSLVVLMFWLNKLTS